MGYMNHKLKENSEDFGYLGLLGAILQQAVKDYESSYKKLVKEKNKSNYNKFFASRLFFVNGCNGYVDPDLAKYVYEKAVKNTEELFTEKEVKFTNEYIKIMDNTK